MDNAIVILQNNPRPLDDVMWTEAIDAGALDCCFDDDGTAIRRAIQRASKASARAAS